jgi:SAM-dependent methyltransferase
VKSELIARQSRLPSGWFGQIVARVMAVETAGANRAAVQRLAPKPGEAILEVGSGHGRTLAAIAEEASFVAGVDASEVMVGVASRRLRHLIEIGRAEVALGRSDALPWRAARFDAALAVHVLYFWPDAAPHLRELLRVLKPGGRVLLGYRPRSAETLAALPASVYTLRTVEEVECLLAGLGFGSVGSVELASGGGPLVLTEARAPAA